MAQFPRFIVYFPTVSGDENYYKISFDTFEDALQYAILNEGNIYDRKTGETVYKFSELSGA